MKMKKYKIEISEQAFGTLYSIYKNYPILFLINNWHYVQSKFTLKDAENYIKEQIEYSNSLKKYIKYY